MIVNVKHSAGIGTIDHGLTDGLTDDDHTNYAWLNGRSGGQTLAGGSAASENLTLKSTSHATKGNVIIPDNEKLSLGTGLDGNIYSTSDNLVIENDTLDKDIIFKVNDGGVDTTVMTIDGDVGRLGVGTITPGAKLEVFSNIDPPAIAKMSYVTTQNYYGAIHVSNTDSTAQNRVGILFKGGSSSERYAGGVASQITVPSSNATTQEADLIFWTNKAGDTNYSTKMTVKGGGDVGIGVTDPDTRLEVYDSDSTQLKLSYDDTDNCTFGVDTNGDLTITPSGDEIITTKIIEILSDSSKLYLGAGKDMTVWYDGTDGNIKTSDVAASDLNIECGTGKTLELQTPVYEDMQFPISTGKIPTSNYPTWESITANISGYSFNVNDYIDLQAAEPAHGWVEASNLDFHMHCTIKDAQNTGANRYAKFQIYAGWAAAGSVWVETNTTGELTITTGSAAFKSYYLDMGDITPTATVIGSMFKARVKRIAATGGTEYGANVFIHQVGAHHQINTLGSRLESSK